jgi:hypothetical protein
MGKGHLGVAAGLLAATCAVAVICAVGQGCTDGTTPDCSDAQCAVLGALEAGGDAAVGDADHDDGDATQASVGDAAEAGPGSEGGPDAGATDGAGDRDAARDAGDSG